MAKGKGDMKGNDFYTGLPHMKNLKCSVCGSPVDELTGVCKKDGHLGM